LNLKNYFVAVILTGLILALAFNHLAGSQTSPSAQYDPWADLNDDGKISMDEIVRMCELFGTTGDPTKNVTVSGYGFKVLSYNINITAHTGGCINIPVSGYRQITLHFNPIFSVILWPYGIRIDRGDNVSVALAFSVGGTFEKLTTFNTNITVSTNPSQPQWYIGTPSLISFTYNIKGEEFLIGYYNPTTNTQRLKISVYLTD